MASANGVRQKLQALLPTLDLDTVTERSIRDRLTADLGPITKHHALIKTEIEKYLSSMGDDSDGGGGAYAPGQASSGSDDDESEDGESGSEGEDEPSERSKPKAAAAKRARPATKAEKAAAAAGASPAAAGNSNKKAKGSEDASGGGGGGGGLVALGGLKKASVSTYKGRVNVDLREYYVDKSSGMEKPSPKGISLPPDQWAQLCAGMPQLSAAMEEGLEGCEVLLGSLRKAYTNRYKGLFLCHVREMYEKFDGTQLPGKKGLALDLKGFKILVKHAAALTEQLGDKAVPASEVKPLAAAAKPTPQKAAAASKAAAAAASSDDGAGASPSGLSPSGGSGSVAKQETANGGGGGGGGVTGGGGSGEPFLADLGNMKRVSVGTYMGSVNVGIREFYVDKVSGEEKPGFKGIALRPEQWTALSAGLTQLIEALSSSKADFGIPLGNLRKAYVSVYKGKSLVHVREMYEKDGAELPGKKGITLDGPTLQLLQQYAAEVTAELANLRS